MHVVVLGSDFNKEELKRTIEKLGGKLVTKIQEEIAVVISTKDDVEKMNERMKLAKTYDIQVVPEKFLESVKDGTPAQTCELIKSMSICDWGSEPLSRIPQEEVREKKESMYNEKKSKVAVKLKNGTAIDPESGLEDVAHVFRQDGVLFTSVLSFTDIQTNKNSFYKLQVLQSDAGREFWLFRSWGRIGTKIGNTKLEKFHSAESACEQFETLFEEKTGNMWNSPVPFRKHPSKYYPVEVDYDDDEKVKKMVEKSKIPSKLKPQVRDLINMLFDIDTMKQTMLEFELDLDKMPLGRLSKKQLHDAYQVLTDLNELVSSGASNNEFIGLSNKFFTLVPHNFGMNKAPVIDTLEMIQTKRDILDNLIEVEIAYSMLQQDTGDELNPLDAHYGQLKTDLKPLDHNSEDFKLLSQYVQNTHAATHKEYSLEIIDVFAVERQGEKRRFKPFKKLHNRQLLWHGSRLTNYVGIMSHGLKIAPPEAPVTGYMFGKGIYFADSVSKSANYCATSKKNDIGLMLLSEVALGDMHELTAANERIKKPPAGKHSVKGVGKSFPNDSQAHLRPDGVKIPLGNLETDNKMKSSLLYNEYIVYDVAQVNIQYLLKMKFHYKKK
jgi:poly [ADP-ribose] polymerase